MFSTLQRSYKHPTEIAHKTMDSAISEMASKEHTVLYIDGEDTVEKKATSESRRLSRDKAEKKATAAMNKVEEQLQHQKIPTKQTHIDIKKNISGAFRLSLDERKQLGKYLQDRGWTVKVAETESDVAIAKDCGPLDTVLTTDSDALIYNNIKTVWRLVSKQKVHCYDVDEVCSELKLESRAHLTALGIVSTNDYHRNIPTLGSATNLGILKEIHGSSKQLARNPCFRSSAVVTTAAN
ncbi:hypothetical protein BGX34_007688 [Mortierella sp. NVP85]|nr:hypothetical protein BGX34_007688 [Mortierella sp. NVP85]